MNNLAEELYNCGITERGNTALFESDGEGGAAFFSEIEEGKWLEVTMNPHNFPAWSISIQDRTFCEMRSYIEENFGNYYFQKNNIGANEYGRMPVDNEYVMECTRDHLYVYHDNKDFEIKDTVTTIHDFLEENNWSLDITDIETLRQEYGS